MLTNYEQRRVKLAISRAVHRAFRAGQAYAMAGSTDTPDDEYRHACAESEAAKASLLRMATALAAGDLNAPGKG
jgi:hypothetical protein